MLSRPKGDVWNLVDNDKASQYYGRTFQLDFSYISSNVIKDIVKDYSWQNYCVGNKVLSSLLSDVRSLFRYFNDFAATRNITALKELTNTDVDLFISYLHTTTSRQRKKPLSLSVQRKILGLLKTIIRWCHIHRPNDVPAIEIFTGHEYHDANLKLKIDFIPDDVVTQINEALKTEDNPYIKYGIIILQSTGMRLGDLLNLRIDCIKPHVISGYTMKWTQYKTRKEMSPIPVRNECVVAINKLIEITAELRDEVEEKYKDTLMIKRVKTGRKVGEVCNLSDRTFHMWLDVFTKKHNIKDANGEYFHLTSHQFRRTLGTDMFSKGTNINVIQQVLGHSTPLITQRFYADIKDKERAEVFKNIGVVGNINQIQSNDFDNESEYAWFKENKETSACMCDGYCMKPIVNGEICERLLKRQKCYTCSRYITTPEYLEVHKQHLANLEMQMEEGTIYGKHYAEHFVPTIQVLKFIIKRLEGLQNGNELDTVTDN